MSTGSFSLDEEARQRFLAELGVLQEHPDETFDRICALAARSLNAPYAFVTLLSGNEVRVKASHGLTVDVLHREGSLTLIGAEATGVVEVRDTLQDPRCLRSELVKGSPFVRYYGGTPLRASNGLVVGTLCVMDVNPRPAPMSTSDRSTLADLAFIATRRLELYAQARQLSQAEEQLRLFKQALDSTNEAVSIARSTAPTDSQIIYANEAVSRLTGYSHDDLIGMSGRILYGEGLEKPEARTLLEAARAAQPARAEVMHRKKDGTPIWVELNMAPVFDSAGALAYWVVVRRDMTHRRQQEQALRQAMEKSEQLAQRLDLALESTSDGVILLDRNWVILYMNHNAQEMVTQGVPKMGRLFWEVFPEAADSAFGQAYRRALETMEPMHVEEYYPPLERWFEVRAYPAPQSLSIFFRDVTVRRAADEKIAIAQSSMREAQRRLQRFFETSLDIICATDAEGRFVEINGACRSILGFEPEELIGKRFLDFVHPQDRESTADIAGGLLNNKPIRNFVNRYMRRDGSVAYLMWTAVWSEEDGRAYSVGRDVTSRLEREQKLRQSQNDLRRAQQLAHLGNWRYSPSDGGFLASEELLLLYGVPRDMDPDAAFSEIRMRVHPEDAEIFESLLSLSSPGNERADVIHRIIDPNGEIRCVRQLAELSPSDGEDTPTIFGATQDITETVRAEEQIRDSELRYRTLFYDNPEPLCVYDRQTLMIVAANPAATALHGYTQEEFVSKTILDIHVPEEIPRLQQELGRDDLAGRAPSVWRHVRKGGTVVYVETVSHGIEFAGRPCRLMLIKDVTERLNLEQQLRQIQKMEAVGQLAGGIAHDFNNLLTVINGYAALLQAQFGAAHPYERELSAILEAGARAAALTSQLLVFSRKQVVQPHALDLNEVIRSVRPILRRLIPENVEIHFIGGKSLGTVKADPTQIEQVIFNLVINARDALPRGGQVTLETRNISIGESFSDAHPDLAEGEYVMLAVSDNGHGMSTEIRSRIFEPFFTTKERGRGTGLGLSTVYGIIRQSGGAITVYSEPELGTTFRVYLPRVDELPAGVPASAEHSLPAGHETVLLVEDNEGVRDFTETILREAGYTVLSAQNGAEAIEISSRTAETIQLLVTDLVMPRMNGRELSQVLRSVRPEIKTLLVSGYTDDVMVSRGILDPSIGFLSKPFSPQTLLAKVRSVLDESQQRGAVGIFATETGMQDWILSVLRQAGYLVSIAEAGHLIGGNLSNYPVTVLVAQVGEEQRAALRTVQKLRQSHPNAKLLLIVEESARLKLLPQLTGAHQILVQPVDEVVLVATVRQMIE